MNQERTPLVVRERHYTYDESIPKYFDQGNAVLTAEWDALSLIIPSGERFFIRSLQRVVDRIRDPELKLQVQAFCRQEGIHAKETCRFLERLQKRGVPVTQFQTWNEKLVKWWERWLPFPVMHLRSTAALEHYTTILALWYFTSRYGQEHISPSPIRDLLNWHCAEELEHKVVAFDVVKEIAPSGYLGRVVSYMIPLFLDWLAFRKALRLILRHDGLSKAEIRKERKEARRLRISLFSLRFPHLWDFLKPDFHPNDLDDGGLGKKILAEQAAESAAS